ncbi:hypothetical protein SLS56_003877 [Neofusicoccum ribis]|uniref:Uncharacterized protein n=1 Tax=Neofusicoccum ribis TaxID=45134 RepID=A0ABR3SXT0_9PEZI
MPRNQSSQSSQVSQSPSDGQHHAVQQHRQQQHKAQRHVVGHGRMGPRNPSYGKNLNKAGAARPTTGDGSGLTRHHQRTLSGSSTPAPAEAQAQGPARPGLKRNASAAVVPRNTSHAALRKNHSSGHLPRQMSTKSMHKHRTSGDLETLKRANKQRSRQASPEPDHPAVRFDLGDDDDGDDDNEWTEESASQSPATTRSNTRQNSVVFEHKQPVHQQQQQSSSDNDTSESTETDAPKPKSHAHAHSHSHSRPTSQPASPSSRRDVDRVTYSSNQINGASSYHQPNLPDADMITSRILQRSASHSLRPQVSDVSATVVSDSHDARSLSHSTGSTMIDTPGNKEAVSRFIDGDGSSGTPRDSSILPHHPKASGGDLTPGKRNKSAPNMADREPPSPHRRRVSSGTATPTDLHPSRTQQKLWLQRASSNIEPQQKEYIPRNGHSTSQLYPAGVTYTPSGEVVIDRELLRRFDEAAAEYKVVRRFRNPVADAITRLAEMPSSPRKNRNAMSVKPGSAHQQRPSTNAGPGPDSGVGGLVRQHSLRASSAGEGMDRERGTPTSVTEAVAAARRARVSFDLPGRGETSQDRAAAEKVEIEEICRRIWERNEMAEGE